MGTEIRPNPVSDQISTKANLLNELCEEAYVRKSMVQSFCQEVSLDSLGYNAKKERLGAYSKLFTGINQSVSMTLTADQVVDDALGRFGGEDISEKEFVDMQEEAQNSIISLTAEIATLNMRLMTLNVASQFGASFGSGETMKSSAAIAATNSMKAQYRASIAGAETLLEGAQDRLNAANEMLEKIRAYCAETDSAHAGTVKEINDAISRGIHEIDCSVFDVQSNTWIPPLKMSWYDDIRNSVAKVRPIIDSANDIYIDGSLNEANCKTLFGLPIYQWFDEEINAMTAAYNNIWRGNRGQLDTDALELFLQCGYVKGETEHIRGDQRLEDKPYTMTEYHLTEGFLGFIGEYTKICSEKKDTSFFDQLALRGGVLMDVSASLPSVWGGVPDFEFEVKTNKDVGIWNSPSAPFCVGITCTSTRYGGSEKTTRILTGSGECQRFITMFIEGDQQGLKDSNNPDEVAFMAFVTTFGGLAKNSTAVILPITIMMNAKDIASAVEISRVADNTIDLVAHKDIVWASDLRGSVSIVDGKPVYYNYGYDTNAIDAGIAKYYDGKPIPQVEDKVLDSSVVIKYIEEGDNPSSILNVDSEDNDILKKETNALLHWRLGNRE